MHLFLSAGQRADVQGYLSGGDGENGGKMAITSLQPGHFGESGSIGQVPVSGRVPAAFLGGSGLFAALSSFRKEGSGRRRTHISWLHLEQGWGGRRESARLLIRLLTDSVRISVKAAQNGSCGQTGPESACQ